MDIAALIALIRVAPQVVENVMRIMREGEPTKEQVADWEQRYAASKSQRDRIIADAESRISGT